MTVYIHVEEGIISEVYGSKTYLVVDWDVLKGGLCPICLSNVYEDNTVDLYCPECGVNWNIADHNTAHLAERGWQIRGRKQKILDLIKHGENDEKQEV